MSSLARGLPKLMLTALLAVAMAGAALGLILAGKAAVLLVLSLIHI